MNASDVEQVVIGAGRDQAMSRSLTEPAVVPTGCQQCCRFS